MLFRSLFGAGNKVAETRSLDHRSWADRVWTTAIVAMAALALWQVGSFILKGVSLTDVGTAAFLGLATLARVIVLIAFASLIWVPVGVWVGTRPRAARIFQPARGMRVSLPKSPPGAISVWRPMVSAHTLREQRRRAISTGLCLALQ